MIQASSPTHTADYQSRIELTEPPELVFDALTTLGGLAGWWAPVTGSGAVGGELQFMFDCHEDPLVIGVDAADFPGLVAWAVKRCAASPEWVGTRITFTLRPGSDGGTTLDFVHEGLTPELDCYDHCRRGWDFYLPSLRDQVETGTGRPAARRAEEAG